MSTTSDSDDDGAAAEKADFIYDLRRLISEIHASGSFAACGTIDSFVNPGICIDPIGIVRLPLSVEDAQALAQTSHKAPFGKGKETLVDESVRKTWQIDAANIRILNQDWQLCLNRILERVAEGLGIAGGPSSIRAELYKMLLYQEGAMFKPHQDTEKVSGMFGTLIICLPSEHTGGAVCLRHRSKSERFDSSGNSAFGASYLTWFVPIEPIQTGYRWVLAYNLINRSPGPPQSASALDARINQFTQALTRWQDLQDKPFYLAYPLDHEYTDRDLKLAYLKGNDFYRARHVAQSCEAHGKYYMLLGNMEMCITDPNSEEEMEKDSVLSLDHIVDPQGFNLLIASTRTISTTNLLRGESYEDREPDTQRGGNYLGNQYAEIDQFFKDSTLIIVPCHWILNFLLGSTFTLHSLALLTTRLRGFIRQAGDSNNPKRLLLQVCQSVLGRDFSNDKDRDLCLGPVAVSAAFLKNPDLFNAIANQIKGSFEEDYYSALGGLICFDGPSIHENLNAFRDGFFKGHPNRSDQLQVNNLQRWLDTLLYGCLYNSEHVYEQDASRLVQIIAEREDAPFSQHVLYQGVRIFVEHFQNNNLLINPLVVELLPQSDHQGRSKIYLETLLRNIVESAVSNFNLRQYATYTASLLPPNQTNSSSRSRGEDARTNSSRHAGPIKALYDYSSAYKQDLSAQLLQRIQATASELAIEQSNGFLISFLSELITVADTGFNEAKSCIRSLITLHIIRTVGYEPKKPTNWTRLEQISTCSHRNDNECLKMNTFLKDPEASYHALGEENYYLRSHFHNFEYFDVEEKGPWNVVGVTKTNKWWEEQHPKWQARAEKVLKAVKKLPQDRLQECLGDEYDGVMDLKMVKVMDDADIDDALQSDEEGKENPELASFVPQKRRRENSEST
ncbi:MAG: hypothetical protein L6R35_003073 [Caloplaca aegaea]|nr:MAG: hypothetical protein L6R35_003073 [Caloplaca aegaea]